MARICQVFHCDKVGDRLCCADCLLPCEKRCLNGPERCRLVDPARTMELSQVMQNGTAPTGARHSRSYRMSPAQKRQLYRLLSQGAAPGAAAKQLGIASSAVYYHAKKLREEGSPYG